LIGRTDILVIGAGPVGLFTVFQAGMLGMKCSVIDALEQIGGQCSALYPEKPIYDIPGYPEISGQGLIDNLAKQAHPFSPTFYLDQKAVKLIKTNYGYQVVTSKDKIIEAKCIIIAAGSGAFGPKKPPLENLENFEQKSIFYNVTKISNFIGMKVAIAGGGDSAIDWAITLSNVADFVYVIHRRNNFRCAPESYNKLNKLVELGKIEIVAPYQLHSLKGEDATLQQVIVQDFDGNLRELEADCLLPFFGLAADLGPISDWGLNLDHNHIKVDMTTMETNVPGIYAVGDIATYQNKLKLILTGFAEVASAAHSAYKYVFPNKALHFEYSTSKGISNL